jgi:hypothetical protein
MAIVCEKRIEEEKCAGRLPWLVFTAIARPDRAIWIPLLAALRLF